MIAIFPIIGIIITVSVHIIWSNYRYSLYQKFDHNFSTKKFINSSRNASAVIKLCNDDAVNAQNDFHKALSIAVSMIFSSFILFSISLSWDIKNNDYLYSIYASEAFLMIAASIVINTSIEKKHIWLKSRALTELIRRQYFVKFVGGLGKDELPEDYFNILIIKYRHELNETSMSNLEKYCYEDFQSLLISAMEKSAIPENIEEFYEKRIFRQKIWFTQALKRLQKQILDREKIIKYCFFLVIFLALIKAVHYSGLFVPYFNYIKSFINLLALSAMGFTVLTAAIIINTGALPLSARYSSQITSIENIIAEDNLPYQLKILEFEKLMQEELSFFLRGLGYHGIEVSL